VTAQPTDNMRAIVEAFRVYVEDSTAGDDRYGPPSRCDRPDGSMLASRFDVGEGWCLEVAILPAASAVRVGFATGDPAKAEELRECVEESGLTPSQFVEMGFREAGLGWSEPPVEQAQDGDGSRCFAVSFTLEDLGDLDLSDVRDKTVRMLEGLLIAFGPSVVIEETDEEDEVDD